MKWLIAIIILLASFTVVEPNFIEIYNANGQNIQLAIDKSRITDNLIWLPRLAHELNKISVLQSFFVNYTLDNVLEIYLNMHKVTAVLANNKLVTSVGVVAGNWPGALPFYDCALSDVSLVTKWLQDNAKIIAQYPFAIKEVGYDHTAKQWRLLWDNDLLLMLGHTKIASKNLERLQLILPKLKKRKLVLSRRVIDMRYANGFAYSKI